LIPSFITSEMSDDLEVALQLGLESGVDTVHLRKGIFGKEVHELESEDFPRIQDTFGKFGVQVGVLMPPFAKCDLDDTETIKQHHELFARTVTAAKALGTRYVRCFPFLGAVDVDHTPARLDDYLGRIVDNLRPSVKHAEAEDITMCFEVIKTTIARSAADTRRIVDALDSSVTEIIWENDSAYRVGEKPSEGYSYIEGKIRDVHIKTNDRDEMNPIGDTGETYTDVIHRLHTDGYTGFLTIEHWQGEKGTLRGLRQLTEILTDLK
jgi:sugar phosphate isomerase/epimerase